jgi:hypothetical protein
MVSFNTWNILNALGLLLMIYLLEWTLTFPLHLHVLHMDSTVVSGQFNVVEGLKRTNQIVGFGRS